MNLPSGLLKNACDSFNIWSILLGKNMRWKKAKIRQEEEWVVPLCGILICLFFRSQSYLVLLFFNKWSVFLAKTKAFFKKHFNPYHITRQLKTRGMFFIKTVQSYLGGNAADFGVDHWSMLIRRTQKDTIVFLELACHPCFPFHSVQRATLKRSDLHICFV